VPRSLPPLLLAALLAVGLSLAPTARGERAPWAEVVTAENAPAALVGGPDAVGGIGDLAFGNGLICGVVSHPSQAMDVSPGGGFLVDLGHCGAGDDHLANLVTLVNVSRKNVPRVESIRAEADAGEARVVTTARWNGIEIRTAYAVAAGEHALRIDTEVVRVASEGRFVILGLLAVHPSGSLRTFTLDTELPELSSGFDHPPSPGEGWSQVFRGLERADVQVMIADDGFGGGASYGLQLESAVLERGDEAPLRVPVVALNGVPFTVLGVFTRPFWVGGGPRLGLLEIAQAPLMDLPSGATLRLRHRLHVGARPDVASVSDRLWPEGPLVSGRVDRLGGGHQQLPALGEGQLLQGREAVAAGVLDAGRHVEALGAGLGQDLLGRGVDELARGTAAGLPLAGDVAVEGLHLEFSVFSFQFSVFGVSAVGRRIPSSGSDN